MKHETRVEIEGLRHEIQLVAEGVTQTREMLGREAADIRQELRSTTAETHALIRFSYTQLDRRVSKLEETQNQR
ncbi:MAG: hypothetical protein ACJ74H_04550 [Thermoanaerobaculia bacterium]